MLLQRKFLLLPQSYSRFQIIPEFLWGTSKLPSNQISPRSQQLCRGLRNLQIADLGGGHHCWWVRVAQRSQRSNAPASRHPWSLSPVWRRRRIRNRKIGRGRALSPKIKVLSRLTPVRNFLMWNDNNILILLFLLTTATERDNDFIIRCFVFETERKFQTAGISESLVKCESG